MSTIQAAPVDDGVEDEKPMHFDGAAKVEGGQPAVEPGSNDQPYAPLRLEGSEPLADAETSSDTPNDGGQGVDFGKSPTHFQVRTIGELVTNEYAEPTALITDPRGRLLVAATDPLLIHGDWRSGKTWLMLDMGLSLASGRPLFGHFPVAGQRSVLYIGAEGTAATFSDRAKQLLEIRGLSHEELGDRFKLIIMGEQGGSASLILDEPSSVVSLVESLVDDPPDVIMIDPLANFMRGEETNDGMKVIVQQVRRIGQAIGAQVFLAHHDVKNAETYGDASKRARGGGALAAGMGVLSLEGEQKDDGWSIKVRSNPKEGAPLPQFEIRWFTADDAETGRPRLRKVEIDTGDDMTFTEPQWKVLKATSGHSDRPITSLRELESLTGLTHGTVQRTVQDLIRLNLVEKDPAEGYRSKPGATTRTSGRRIAYGGPRSGGGTPAEGDPVDGQ